MRATPVIDTALPAATTKGRPAVLGTKHMTAAASGVCAIRRLETGSLEGGADPRRESYAVGW